MSAEHCDSCDPGFSCWSAPENCRKPDSRAHCAVAPGSSGERPLTDYAHDELVTLTIEIAGRLAMWNTREMFDRLHECRAELLKRLHSNRKS